MAINREDITDNPKKVELYSARASETLGRNRTNRITEGKSIGPDFSTPQRASRVDNSSKPVSRHHKSSSTKSLKDTSGDYWSPTGTGDIGSASGEVGANMGQVNKGGYDPTKGVHKTWDDSY